jgi:cytochrome c6
MRFNLSNPSVRFALGISAVFVVLFFVVRGSPVVAAGEGEALYKARCAGCHGPDGAGQTPTGKSLKVRDMRSPEVQKQSDGELTDIIAKGKNKMPPFEKSLKPEQIKDLVAQIRSLKK